MTDQIRIALPSKGRMEGETMAFLEDCGLKVNKTNPRQYSATIPALPNVLVLFQRPRDIAVSVVNGDVDLGITGYDTVAEALTRTNEQNLYVIHEALDYGHCRLVLAVPDEWTDILTLDDLSQKAKRGDEIRLATKYRNAVSRFLQDHAIENVRVVYADGALEAAPQIGYAEFIADITSSGTTLRENHMHTLEGGTIVESEAVFIGNVESLQTRPDVLAIAEHILELIEAELRARGKYLIFANMRGGSIEDVASRVATQSELGGLQHPTIARLGTPNWWSVSVVVSQTNLYKAIQQIRSIDGSGVVVTPVSYIFDEKPERCTRLLEMIRKEAAQ